MLNILITFKIFRTIQFDQKKKITNSNFMKWLHRKFQGSYIQNHDKNI